MTTETTDKPTRCKDWDLIEKDWRAGIKTKAQMAAEYGVSRAAMDKHFAKKKIQRDLADKIRDRAAAMVAKDALPAQVDPLAPADERDLVEVNAAMQATVLLSHRKDIQRGRSLARSLLQELELQTDNLPLLHQLAEIMYAPDEKGQDKRNELFNKVISLNSRAGTAKTLTDSLRTLIALERQAFGLDDEGDKQENSGIDALIKNVKAKHAGD